MKTYVSCNRDELDLKMIANYLSNESYWAKGRSFEKIKLSIQNSICFGAYDHNNKQIGFARVVTDQAVFAWVMDVFVLEEYQGEGVGKQLMKAMFEHPSLQGLQRWGLCTYDAHGLYKKFGFEELEKPEIHMELIKPSL